MEYRRDIDGLRALAVIPVILYHAGLPGMDGGFVGVDVFFIISGYLITAILLREMQAGAFSFAAFYERRARRILPALFVVMLVCLPGAWVWMLPYQLLEFSRSLIATSVFGSNVLFWLESGYFEGPATQKPLLHTWSLAVEEQFYILAPMVLALLWRFGRAWLWMGVIALTALSLDMAHRYVWGDVTFSFYMLPTRAWELLAGVLLALYLSRRARPDGRLADMGATLGVMMVLGTMLVMNDSPAWPSPWTLIPVVGTVLILLCARPENLVGRVLGWGPLVGIGLISYSAYLWHYPLFAFARLQADGTPAPLTMAFLAGFTLILAAVSWKLVEQPVRQRRVLKTRGSLCLTGLSFILVFVSVAAVFWQTRGGIMRFPAHQQAWVSTLPEEYDAYLEGSYRHTAVASWKRIKAGDARPVLLLIGDSFSQDVFNAIQESEAFKEYLIIGDYVSAPCQIYKGLEDVSRFRAPKDRRFCANLKRPRMDRVALADVIILAGVWRPWAIERLPETIRNLKLQDTQRLFVLGVKSFPYSLRRDLLPLSLGAVKELRVSPLPEFRNANIKMRDVLGQTGFIDVMKASCGPQERCPLVTSDGALISNDGRHLTQAGARWLGDILFRTTALSEFAAPTD